MRIEYYQGNGYVAVWVDDESSVDVNPVPPRNEIQAIAALAQLLANGAAPNAVDQWFTQHSGVTDIVADFLNAHGPESDTLSVQVIPPGGAADWTIGFLPLHTAPAGDNLWDDRVAAGQALLAWVNPLLPPPPPPPPHGAGG